MLGEGGLLGIFPEGAIARDGRLGEFEAGIMKILQTHPVPVVPLALQSQVFAGRDGDSAARRPWLRGRFGAVALVAGPALAAAEVTPAVLRARVAALLAS